MSVRAGPRLRGYLLFSENTSAVQTSPSLTDGPDVRSLASLRGPSTPSSVPPENGMTRTHWILVAVVLFFVLVGVSQRNGNQKTVPALQPLTNREASLIEATGASRIRLRAQRAASLNAEPRLRTGTPTNNRPADREAWCAPKDGASNRCAGRTNRETPGPARPESTASKRVTCAWRQELSGHSRRYRCGSERRTEVGRYGYVQEANSSRAPRQGGCPAR